MSEKKTVIQEKSYIERVTNLERAKIEYVPKEIFDNLLEEFEESEERYLDAICEPTSIDRDFHEDYIQNKVDHQRELAKEKAVELYALSDNSIADKRPINVCPYCGDVMSLSWVGGTYAYSGDLSRRGTFSSPIATYVCLRCGSRSPEVRVPTALIDQALLAKAIGNNIAQNIDDREEEERIHE